MRCHYELHSAPRESDAATDAATVVLVHGVGMDRTMWRHQVPRLTPHAPVLTYDLRGHGRSPVQPLVTDLADFVDDLSLLLDEQADAAPIDLVGFSLGGLIAQSYAASNPGRVRRLVLSNTFALRSEAEREMAVERMRVLELDHGRTLVDESLGRWFTADFLAQERDNLSWISTSLVEVDRAAYLAAYRVTVYGDLALEDVSRRVESPTLVLTSEHDIGAPPQMAHRLAQAIPNAEVKIMPRLRHMAMVEDPELYSETILSFLRRNSI